MPRKDKYHDTVRNALVKDGWRITADPLLIEFKRTQLWADLAAEKPENGTRKITIEVKVMDLPGRFTKFECAVGQYVVYRRLMINLNDERELFLAIPNGVFKEFFQKKPAVMDIVAGERIKLLVFDVEREEVVQWIS